MATKKSAASTNKSVKKPAPSAKKSTITKVTTVKAGSAASPVASRTARFRKFGRAPLLSASVAEFVGTFLLAAIVIVTSGQPLFIMFGLVAIVLAIGVASGAYVNPALTIGALATRRITVKRAAAFTVAQVLGAILALVVFNAFVTTAPEVSQEAALYGQTAPELFAANPVTEGKEWTILAAELLGSVVFAFGAASMIRQKNSIAKAFVMGGSFYLGLIIAGTAAGYVSGSAVLNPAVAVTLQAFAQWELWPVMIYALTPLVGGVLGYALSDLVHDKNGSVA
jgi:aquaporin Z